MIKQRGLEFGQFTETLRKIIKKATDVGAAVGIRTYKLTRYSVTFSDKFVGVILLNVHLILNI